MILQLVDVQFDDDITRICRIKGERDDEYVVSELVYKSCGVYDFSEEELLIPKDSVCGFYDTTELEDTGLFIKTPGGFYEPVDDSDYEYEMSSEEEDSESDISLDDEDE